MASKANKGSPAPTASKKPVVLDKKESAKAARAAKLEAERQERIAKRAERSAANKAAHAANRQAATEAAKISLASLRAIGVLGRPPIPWEDKYEEPLFELISTGHTMDQIASMEDMPSLFCLLKWKADDTHPFSKIYARAKENLIALFEERAAVAAIQPELFELRTRKQVVTRDGDVVWVTEKKVIDNVARSALKLQAYQWTLSHLKPKKHGRTPDQSSGTANEQLRGLFDALKAGPVDTN